MQFVCHNSNIAIQHCPFSPVTCISATAIYLQECIHDNNNVIFSHWIFSWNFQMACEFNQTFLKISSKKALQEGPDWHEVLSLIAALGKLWFHHWRYIDVQLICLQNIIGGSFWRCLEVDGINQRFESYKHLPPFPLSLFEEQINIIFWRWTNW